MTTRHEHAAWTAEPAAPERKPLPLHVYLIVVMALSIIADVFQITGAQL